MMVEIHRPTSVTPWGEDNSIMANMNWTAGNYVNNHSNISDISANNTANDPGDSANGTESMWSIISAILYALICVTGLMGNGLVIFVVLRYAKMKTVTNMYILNLAVADLCFLIGLPILIITSILRRWIFGFVLCKLFYISTSINWYTSVFTLTAMSADRYLAVCHPITSMRYRTPIISRIVCVCVWSASLLTMLPMVLYTTTKPNELGTGVSCTIEWPPNGSIPNWKAFIWYAFFLGFAIPVCLIVVFYTSVVMKLKTIGPKNKSKGTKKSHKKVTQMVLTVITVYVSCWMPYWVFQIVLNHINSMRQWMIHLFQIITVLSYANSMMNPLVYAFLSENFRKSFAKAFKCATEAEVNRALQGDHSMAPGKHCAKPSTTRTTFTTQSSKSAASGINKMLPVPEEEMEALTNNTTASNGNGMLSVKPEAHKTETQVAVVDSNEHNVVIGKVNGQNSQTVTML